MQCSIFLTSLQRDQLLSEHVKLPRKSSVKRPSTFSLTCSEKLEIPDSIARKRRKLMFDNAIAVNSRRTDDKPSKRKHALNGLWNTFINTATEQEVRSYLEHSPKVMKKAIPPIINAAVKKYEHSQANLIRSVAVLYEGGISSKKQYNRKRSREVFEVDDAGKKHQVITVITLLIFPWDVAPRKGKNVL